MREIAICPNCGKEFVKEYADQMYCSHKCGDQHRYFTHYRDTDGHVLDHSRIFRCINCGRLVITEQKDKRYKFCSQRCKWHYAKRKKRGEVKE